MKDERVEDWENSSDDKATNSDSTSLRPKLVANKFLLILGVLVSICFLGFIGLFIIVFYYVLKDMYLKKHYGSDSYDVW